MKRRAFLAGAAGGVAGVAGCIGGTAGGGEPARGGNNTTDGGVESVGGVDLPVPEDELVRGAPKDAIPAITDPAFGDDWRGVSLTVRSTYDGVEHEITPRLRDDDRVVGVERAGTARAYPLRVLDWHEVVNDDLDGPLLVTYCPLCGSGVTADRLVDGEPAVFGVSGWLFRSNLVLYDDATESLWSQIAATAIRGPETGERLSLVPSTITTWGAWRDDHPDTRVLRPPPDSGTVGGEQVRNYNQNPYEGYENTTRVGIGTEEFDDDRLHPKTQVFGVAAGGEAVAYPLPAVREAGVVNDAVGGLPVVVAVDPREERLVAYVRRVGGETLEFAAADGAFVRAGGSRWSVGSGRAVDGPHEGTRLDHATETPPMFWFAWLEFHPDSAVYGEAG
jgi:hypothetical protein